MSTATTTVVYQGDSVIGYAEPLPTLKHDDAWAVTDPAGKLVGWIRFDDTSDTPFLTANGSFTQLPLAAEDLLARCWL